jgi:hypothetical protein
LAFGVCDHFKVQEIGKSCTLKCSRVSGQE